MGLSDVFKGMFSKKSEMPEGKGTNELKCPNCATPISLSMERCPSCGVRIKSMFRMRCPKCNALNELGSKKCSKCFYDFSVPSEKPKKSYVCPICGYEMDTFLTSCPACSTSFV
ncbi:hypothetical protein HY990_00915 [Candidatus Micrarchaeota archaeon]|nr:hypothetical protein [Candidatus Micrarchaeota archaeon]